MENLEVISVFINQVGVPVAMLVGCGWYINKRDKEHIAERDGWQSAMERNTEALANNTLVMHQMLEVLRKEA